VEREFVIADYETEIIQRAIDEFQLDPEKIDQFKAYEGCENLVYACERQNQPVILRVSYRPDRNLDQIQAEIDFIRFLGENGVRASQPIPSEQKKMIETLSLDDKDLYLVCFERARGMRVPDNHYRYRQDAPIEEYFRNWGRILGQMHSLSRGYRIKDKHLSRPDWFELHANKLNLEAVVPKGLTRLRNRVDDLLQEICSLPQEKTAYGLIHGDFNDGNFTVDYSNGDITVFDFDDSCYFWFAYELASAWEGGIGRVMYGDLAERKSFMDHYMKLVLSGYSEENHLPEEWIERIPLFIKLIQVEELLHYLQYYEMAEHESHSHLQYLIVCLESDLPYMGFFDPIYSPESPFSLKT
jgi:Ser/Thr protein kinase RdoA (MazF antagonist)